MARDSAEGKNEAPSYSRLSSLVADFALSLREKHVARCQALEEEHLDQAIEQEVRTSITTSNSTAVTGVVLAYSNNSTAVHSSRLLCMPAISSLL